ALLSDLGGEENLSTQKQALVEDVVRRKLFLDHVDAHLLELRTLLTRKGDLKPLVLKRERLADGLRGVLVTLGLERVARRVPDLKTYLEERYGGSEGREHGGPATQRAAGSPEEPRGIE